MSDNPYQPKLVFVSAPFAGRSYELTLEKVSVGRAGHNTLAIHDPSVSLAHCEILVNGPEVIIRDLGSSNGTFVEGARLQHQQSQIKSGQLVRFGSVEARLELDPTALEHTATEITAVHELGRILRDQRRERRSPKPADPSMTLDAGEDSSEGERTVLMPQSPPIREIPAPRVQEEAHRPVKEASGRVGLVMAAAVLLGLAVIIWLIWRK